MNPLTAFGLFAVSAMLACYALEHRGRGFILGFAGACALGSVYGFLQGAWPFGLVEAIWSLVALRRWWLAGPQSGMARRVIYGSDKIRAAFKSAVGAEIDDCCSAIDSALKAADQAYARAQRLAGDSRRRHMVLQLVVRKGINDALGAIEILCSGYYEMAIGGLRTGFEGWATAVLVSEDDSIYRDFINDRYSANTSIAKLLKRKGHISSELHPVVDQGYKKMHDFAHASSDSIKSQMPVKADGFPIGGHFEDEKIDRYRLLLADIKNLSRNFEGFIRTYFSLGAPDWVRVGDSK